MGIETLPSNCNSASNIGDSEADDTTHTNLPRFMTKTVEQQHLRHLSIWSQCLRLCHTTIAWQISSNSPGESSPAKMNFAWTYQIPILNTLRLNKFIAWPFLLVTHGHGNTPPTVTLSPSTESDPTPSPSDAPLPLQVVGYDVSRTSPI